MALERANVWREGEKGREKGAWMNRVASYCKATLHRPASSHHPLSLSQANPNLDFLHPHASAQSLLAGNEQKESLASAANTLLKVVNVSY